jgi:hypothetical protein
MKVMAEMLSHRAMHMSGLQNSEPEEDAVLIAIVGVGH